jgi:hypothetical protein
MHQVANDFLLPDAAVYAGLLDGVVDAYLNLAFQRRVVGRRAVVEGDDIGRAGMAEERFVEADHFELFNNMDCDLEVVLAEQGTERMVGKLAQRAQV